MSRWRRAGLGVLAVTLGGWLATGFTVVAPGEVVVVRRLGRTIEPVWTAGPHWGAPLGIDHREHIRTDEVRRLTIGRTGDEQRGDAPGAAEFLVGDRNFVRVGATIQYRVSDPVQFSRRPENAENLLAAWAESSLCRALAGRGIDAVLRSERVALGASVAEELNQRARSGQHGVAVLGVILTDARPPVEVQAAFAEAQAAASARERRAQEAEAYGLALQPITRSRARALLDAATAAVTRTTALARSDADRFEALRVEAGRDPVATRRRLYRDMLAALLPRLGRTLVVPAGESVDLSLFGVGATGASPAPPVAPAVGPDSLRPAPNR